jgi:hypothetical protein
MISELEVSYRCGHVCVVKDVHIQNRPEEIFRFLTTSRERICPMCNRKGMYPLGKNIQII